jgi:hypothetical protein
MGIFQNLRQKCLSLRIARALRTRVREEEFPPIFRRAPIPLRVSREGGFPAFSIARLYPKNRIAREEISQILRRARIPEKKKEENRENPLFFLAQLLFFSRAYALKKRKQKPRSLS